MMVLHLVWSVVVLRASYDNKNAFVLRHALQADFRFLKLSTGRPRQPASRDNPVFAPWGRQRSSANLGRWILGGPELGCRSCWQRLFVVNRLCSRLGGLPTGDMARGRTKEWWTPSFVLLCGVSFCSLSRD